MKLRDLSNRLDRYLAVENTKRALPLTLTERQKAVLLLQGMNRVLADFPDFITKKYTIPAFTNQSSVTLPNDVNIIKRITDGTTDYGFSYNDSPDVYSTAGMSGWTVVFEDGTYKLKFPEPQSFTNLEIYYTPVIDELENLIATTSASPLSIQIDIPPAYTEAVVLGALASVYRDSALETQYITAIRRLKLQRPKPDRIPPYIKSWRF